jgi:hypothetical protein
LSSDEKISAPSFNAFQRILPRMIIGFLLPILCQLNVINPPNPGSATGAGAEAASGAGRAAAAAMAAKAEKVRTLKNCIL